PHPPPAAPLVHAQGRRANDQGQEADDAPPLSKLLDDCFRGRVCAGAGQIKLGGGSRATPIPGVLASPMTPIQRRYGASSACAGSWKQSSTRSGAAAARATGAAAGARHAPELVRGGARGREPARGPR